MSLHKPFKPEELEKWNKIFMSGYQKGIEACIQAITDNPHKSPIEAITDMRRKNG